MLRMVLAAVVLVGLVIAGTGAAHAQGFSRFEDDVLQRPQVQTLDGRKYAAVRYANLKTYFDSLCRYDETARLIGRRVAVIGVYWSAESYHVKLDDGVYEALFNPDKPKSVLSPGPGRIDPLFARFKTGQIDRNSTFYRACDATLAKFTKACVVAIYGVVRRKAKVGAKQGAAGIYMSESECYLDVMGVRRVAIQDRASWIGNAAIEGAIAGFNAGKNLALP